MDIAKAKILFPQLASMSDDQVALLQAAVDANQLTGQMSSMSGNLAEVKAILSFFAVLKAMKWPE